MSSKELEELRTLEHRRLDLRQREVEDAERHRQCEFEHRRALDLRELELRGRELDLRGRELDLRERELAFRTRAHDANFELRLRACEARELELQLLQLLLQQQQKVDSCT